MNTQTSKPLKPQNIETESNKHFSDEVQCRKSLKVYYKPSLEVGDGVVVASKLF